MNIEGIDRLVIGVKDMDRALAFFRDVLGAEFTEIKGPSADMAGCRVAASLDMHLELISPVAEPQKLTNPPDPLALRRRLEGADAVLYAVIFKVRDLNAAIVNAERHGVRLAGDRITYARHERLRISDFDEVALDEAATFGIKMALAQYRRDLV